MIFPEQNLLHLPIMCIAGYVSELVKGKWLHLDGALPEKELCDWEYSRLKAEI
jgi:hypothetical protein